MTHPSQTDDPGGDRPPAAPVPPGPPVPSNGADGYTIRRSAAGDEPAVQRLLADHHPLNGPPDDPPGAAGSGGAVDLRAPGGSGGSGGGGHRWIAQAGDRIIGTVALTRGRRRVGHLHGLRVAPDWRIGHRVARRLVEAAAAYAREAGLLKLITPVPADAEARVVSYFHFLGFEFSRKREHAGRDILEFSLNLTEEPGLTALRDHP